jgi:hypothetical protein
MTRWQYRNKLTSEIPGQSGIALPTLDIPSLAFDKSCLGFGSYRIWRCPLPEEYRKCSDHAQNDANDPTETLALARAGLRQ